VAAYERSRCLAALRAKFEAGERGLTAAITQLGPTILPEAELRTFDRELLSFENANTPEALAQLAARQLTTGEPKGKMP
jgi:molybdopterin-guanine dinucleotide biosynthesis protein A